MNTGMAAAPRGRTDDIVRHSLKADLGLNRSFSVFVNELAINAA
jgi:hypothetical protein